MEQAKEKIILGIDPGTLVTGYGVVSRDSRGRFRAIDYGCIRPPVRLRLTERYRILFSGVGELLEAHQPEAFVVETQYIHRNPQSGMKLAMARAVTLLAASLKGIEIYEYPPARAKKAVVGKGNASKKQVQGMVQRLLSLPVAPEPEDAADALALALCHGQTLQSFAQIRL